MASIWAELKRRKVVRVAVAYAVVGWLLAQVADMIIPALLLPDWALRTLVVFILFGFPVALVLAWSYEIVPDDAGRSSDDTRKEPSVLARSSQRSFLIGVGTLALGLLLGKFIGGGPVVPQPPTVPQSEIRLPLHLDGFMHSALASERGTLAISRDGSSLAYVGYSEGDQYLFIKDAKSGEAKRVADTAGATSPFFSPDGSSVGFGLDGAIRRVPSGGGPSVVVAEPVDLIKGATWGDNDIIVFTDGYRTPLLQVSSAGGPITNVTTLSENETTHRHPEFIPDENILLFEVHTTGVATIWAYDIETGKREKLAAGGMPKYANGNAIFLRRDDANYSIWSAELDLNNLALTSDAVPLIGGVADQLAVSTLGALIYATESGEITNRLLLIDRNGNQRVLSDAGTMNYPRFSPDGDYVAISVRNTNEWNIWIFPTDGPSLGSQATRESGRYPLWSSDGSRISYLKGLAGIHEFALKTDEAEITIVPSDKMTIPLQWTDRGLLYMQLRSKTNGDIFFMNRSGDTRTMLATDPPTTQAYISPNGKWMTYTEWQGNSPALYVQAFPDGNLRWKVSGKRGSNAKWSKDGRTIYYASFNQILSMTVTERNDAPLFGEPQLVYEFSGSGRIAYDPFDISADGNFIAVIDKIYSNPPTQVYVSNWKSMLADN